MARIREDKTGKMHAEFNSVHEVFRVIDRLEWTPQREQASDRRGKDDNFYHFGSLAEARETYTQHPERVRAFNESDKHLVSRDSPGKDVYYDVTGDFLDIDKHLEGIPEVFGNATLGNPKRIFATINILGVYAAVTNKDFVIEKQQRILRLVDWLESQGIRTQIIVGADSQILNWSITVKEFADPFNLNDLAIVLHPDWLRRIMFLVMEQSKTWSWGYGEASAYDNRMLKYKPQPEDGLCIYVGGYMFTNKNKMNEQFDHIEDVVEEMMELGLTFNEDPLTVGKGGGW